MSKERLLEDYQLEESRIAGFKKAKRWYQLSRPTAVLWVAVVCLITGNIFFYQQARHLRGLKYAGASRFSGITYDTPTVYEAHTKYLDPNETVADYHWDHLDTTPMVVALSDEWAAENSIPRSIFRFPWDEERKGIYYLKVYHGLHCLKAMHRAFRDYERGLPSTIAPWHIHHCLDILRQDITCMADDTPMPGVALPNHVGDGQIRMCRNFDKLTQWGQEPERHACYHRITDYGGVKHPIEMYANCPEGSEYRPIMEKYFEENGHKDPFAED